VAGQFFARGSSTDGNGGDIFFNPTGGAPAVYVPGFVIVNTGSGAGVSGDLIP